MTFEADKSRKSLLKKGKSAAAKKRQRVRQREKKALLSVGKDSDLVKLHRADGSVSSNEKNNTIISAGTIKNVHRESLNEVYPGGLCEAALCSFRQGSERLWLCVCDGKRSHSLPITSGPNDKHNWGLVMKKSNAARSTAMNKLASNRK